MEKLFTILNSFLFLKNFSARVDRDANVLPSGIASYKYAAKAATFSVKPVKPVKPVEPVEPVELGIYIPFTI